MTDMCSVVRVTRKSFSLLARCVQTLRNLRIFSSLNHTFISHLSEREYLSMADQTHTVVLNAVKNAPLKLSFVVHFFLTTWGIQGYWSPDSYLFYNILFFFTLLWTIHSKESIDAPLLCLIINASAVLLDVIVLCIYFPRSYNGPADRFSCGMAVLNAIVRPVTCIAIHKVWQERASGNVNQQQPGPSSSYQTIDGNSYGSSQPNF